MGTSLICLHKIPPNVEVSNEFAVARYAYDGRALVLPVHNEPDSNVYALSDGHYVWFDPFPLREEIVERHFHIYSGELSVLTEETIR